MRQRESGPRLSLRKNKRRKWGSERKDQTKMEEECLFPVLAHALHTSPCSKLSRSRHAREHCQERERCNTSFQSLPMYFISPFQTLDPSDFEMNSSTCTESGISLDRSNTTHMQYAQEHSKQTEALQSTPTPTHRQIRCHNTKEATRQVCVHLLLENMPPNGIKQPRRNKNSHHLDEKPPPDTKDEPDGDAEWAIWNENHRACAEDQVIHYQAIR